MERLTCVLVLLALAGCGGDDEPLSAVMTPTPDAQQKQAVLAQDAQAKSNARNLVSEMEACYVTVQRYSGCDLRESGYPLGDGPGQVEISDAGGDTYEITAHSKSGNTFVVSKRPDTDGLLGQLERTCTTVEPGGCDGGTW